MKHVDTCLLFLWIRDCLGAVLQLQCSFVDHDVNAIKCDKASWYRLYKVWMARQYPVYSSNTLLLDNALATMGAGVASAMGAKLVMPDVRPSP